VVRAEARQSTIGKPHQAPITQHEETDIVMYYVVMSNKYMMRRRNMSHEDGDG